MALVLTIGVMTVLLTLGGSLALLAATEARVAGRYRDGVQAFYDAEAALEAAIGRLRREADWPALLGGAGAGEWQPFGPGVLIRDAGDGLVALRAEARAGPGARRVLEATVARSGPGVRLVLWEEVR